MSIVLKSNISRELIEELEGRFPVRRPVPGQSIEAIYEYSGKLALIEFLKHCYNLQNENILNL